MAKTTNAVHGETKTAQLKALMTPTGKQLLQERAKTLGVSVGELLERFARGEEEAQLGESSAVS